MIIKFYDYQIVTDCHQEKQIGGYVCVLNGPFGQMTRDILSMWQKFLLPALVLGGV